MTTSRKLKSLKKEFLDRYLARNNITAICDAMQIKRMNVYKWRERDEEFAQEWDDTAARWENNARESIYNRGIIGWDEPLISQGKVVRDEFGGVMYVKRHSDILATLYAKAYLPEYKEKNNNIEIHTQIAAVAETAKTELLTSLAMSLSDEPQKQIHEPSQE